MKTSLGAFVLSGPFFDLSHIAIAKTNFVVEFNAA